ncbi:MAG: iron-sulfur cluster assembly scaffold protein [Candidatus Aminicenantes bacterium]|nr:iron-sulfur cluster assembly scaffold protein [Candidatus Aminicenantes bacterium]
MRRFSDKVIEHFSNPQNVGIIERPEGIATITNPVCGDVTEIYLRIKEGIIEDAKFKSFGCAVTIASASVFTENIKGKDISKLVSGRDEETVRQLVGLVENELGELPPQKLHCPPATIQAFLEAILQYNEGKGETQLASRIKKLIPLVSKYYERGEKAEDDIIT